MFRILLSKLFHVHALSRFLCALFVTFSIFSCFDFFSSVEQYAAPVCCSLSFQWIERPAILVVVVTHAILAVDRSSSAHSRIARQNWMAGVVTL